MKSPGVFRRWIWCWAAGYGVLMAAVVWSVIFARAWALAELATPQSTAEWEAWREDVRAQQGQPTPIQRRVPKSSEPPALVLAREYFAVVFVAAVVFTSLLYWVMAWLISGAISPAATTTSDRPAS